MGNIKRVQRCHLCGAVLQSRTKKEKGFISASILNNENYKESILYCDTCLEKMKNINKTMLEQDADSDILTVLKDANATDGVIIYVVDAFLFTGAINPEVAKRINKLKVSVIATHADLFSKKDRESVKNFINDRFAEAGINVVGISLVSKFDNADTLDMYNKINEFRQGHDVYMIGSVASGKTSIINMFLKTYKNNTKRLIKQSTYEGTNLKIMEIPLSNSSFLYELPGFSLCNRISSNLEKEIDKQLVVYKHMRVLPAHLTKGESMFVGNLCGITLLKGKDTNFRFYCPDTAMLIKTKEADYLEALEKISDKQYLKLISGNLLSFADYDVFDYEMEDDGKSHDIAILGLGWFKFIAKGQTFRIIVPKQTEVKESLSKVK